MEPILKWAGGKRQLLPELKKYITPELLKGHSLIEPFVGGGSVFLSMEHDSVIINDYNSELINVYKRIKHNPFRLIEKLELYKKNHSKEFYYKIRELDRLPDYDKMSAIDKAARTIYLNRTCFNGLYRVNSNGFFNVPIGRYSNPDIVQKDKIVSIHNYLYQKNITIICGDFEKSVERAIPGDVVYFDPPYDFEETGFTEYTANSFSRKDLIRMKELCDKLVTSGCTVIISNNDTEYVNSLFSDRKYIINHVSAKRMINSNASNRNEFMEVIIVGYPK